MTDFAQDVRRTHGDPVLRRLMIVLSGLAVLGMIGTAAAVIGAQESRNASAADVRRAEDIVRALTAYQVQAEIRTYNTRQDNRVLLDAICDQIEAVADQARLTIPPCPNLPPVPTPAPAPTPAT